MYVYLCTIHILLLSIPCVYEVYTVGIKIQAKKPPQALDKQQGVGGGEGVRGVGGLISVYLHI